MFGEKTSMNAITQPLYAVCVVHIEIKRSGLWNRIYVKIINQKKTSSAELILSIINVYDFISVINGIVSAFIRYVSKIKFCGTPVFIHLYFVSNDFISHI